MTLPTIKTKADGIEEAQGTADALRLVAPRLTSARVMVLSCDFVTDLPIHNLTDVHRVHGAAVTALFVKTPLDPKNIPVPGPKSKPEKGSCFKAQLSSVFGLSNSLCTI